MSNETEPSRWVLIDHALVGLKTTELAEEMHKSIKAEENQIRFDTRHNQNSQAVPSLLLQMHERHIDEHIEKTYKLYCDVWEKQGYTKTAGVDPNFETTRTPIEFSEGGLVCRNGGLPGNLS